MNKPIFDAMVAQYAVQEASGDGAASWDGGVRCVLPEVLVYGKAVQNGTPTPDAPVMPEFSAGTEAVSRGENLADIYGFSCDSIRNPNAVRALSNSYGTTISTIDPTNVITFKQAKVGNPAAPRDYANGFFNVGVYNNFKVGEDVVVSFDLEITEDPLGVGTVGVGSNGGNFQGCTPMGGNRFQSSLEWYTYQERQYIEFRLAGISGTISNIQIEEGTTATPYVPHFDGGSATAPELLAIPGTEYRDEWNPQTGKGVRKVGKLVLDGTENWLSFANGVFLEFAHSVSVGCCSHFIDDKNFQWLDAIGYWSSDINAYAFHFFGYTVDEWKSYLAAQHAAGTPVTVWYALKEPVPFQTEPQPLIQPKGTGHIMQVGGNLDGCPISAKYVTHS